MRGESAWRVGLGLTAAITAPGRAVTRVGFRAASGGWQSSLMAPVRQPVEAVARAAEERGGREDQRLIADARKASNDLLDWFAGQLLDGDTLERLIAIAAERGTGMRTADAILAGDGAEQLLVHLADQPGLDAIIARVLGSEAFEERLAALLDDPALERLLARVLASRFADRATDQLLASDELRRIVAYVARSEEVRGALQAQSAGLATEVAGEIRDRSSTVDDALERRARRLLRRRPRTVPVAEVADAGPIGP